MYTKQEASQLRQEFWSAFGQYMLPILSADGLKVNWVNYKTGIKDVLFRMSADHQNARIGIELVHKDEGIRHLYFQQFQQLKSLLHEITQEEWEWERDIYDEYGKVLSRISRTKEGVNIFSKESWPAIISFLKPRIMALDEFWTSVNHVFDSMK